MRTFKLKIVTPYGVHFEGEAESILVRTVAGDAQILAGHVDYVTALGIGRAAVYTRDGKRRYACCSNGVLSVINGEVTVLASTFEWKEEIDLERANAALEKGRKMLEEADNPKDAEIARLKIQRAIIRQNVKQLED